MKEKTVLDARQIRLLLEIVYNTEPTLFTENRRKKIEDAVWEVFQPEIEESWDAARGSNRGSES